MTRLSCWLVVASLSLLAHPPPALSAVDMFLKLDGIDGESIVKGHEKWIEIQSYSWGLSNSGSFAAGGGGGAGKVQFQDFHFGKVIDASSPKLFQFTASGDHIGKAIFEVVKPVGGGSSEPFLKYELTDVMVTSYSVSSGGEIPTDSFSLNFAKVKTEYRPTDSKSGKLGPPIIASWDLKQNQSPPIPEPSTWAMLIAGLAFVAYRGRRMMHARAA